MVDGEISHFSENSFILSPSIPMYLSIARYFISQFLRFQYFFKNYNSAVGACQGEKGGFDLTNFAKDFSKSFASS